MGQSAHTQTLSDRTIRFVFKLAVFVLSLLPMMLLVWPAVQHIIQTQTPSTRSSGTRGIGPSVSCA